MYGERKPVIPKIKILNKLKKESKVEERKLGKGGVPIEEDI